MPTLNSVLGQVLINSQNNQNQSNQLLSLLLQTRQPDEILTALNPNLDQALELLGQEPWPTSGFQTPLH